MSALQLPPSTPTATPSGGGHLRLVEPPAPSLAPSGPAQAWRRRLAALLLVVAVAVLVGQVLVRPAPALVPVTAPASAATVVVQPGQTLWDIAVTHAPDGTTTWTYVDRLAELNGVTAGQLQPWQVLRLPGA